MKRQAWTLGVVIALLSGLGVRAQEAASQATTAPVPRLMRFSGTVQDADAKPLSGVVGITFALYSQQTEGAALWLETQNVQADSRGHYTVLLGATKPDGLPTDVFISGEARWLGMQPAGQAEQPRVLLVSTPYALKAGDAATVGGFPPSAFVLAKPATAGGSATSGIAPTASTGSAAVTSGSPGAVTPVGSVTGTGTKNFVPLWTSSSALGSSAIFQNTNKLIGIGTTSPAGTLDVNGTSFIRGALNLPPPAAATALKGQNSNPLNLTASAFNSGTHAAVQQTFRWQAEPLFNNSNPPSGTLNLLFASGNSVPAETGILITGSGEIDAPTVFATNSLVAHGTFAGNTGSFISLGIGEGPPEARLDVFGGGGVDTLIGDPGCGTNFAGVGFSPFGTPMNCTNYALLGDNVGDTYVNSHGAGSIQFRNNSNFSPDQMIILSNGNVGIGTNSPGVPLDVAGRIRSQNLTQQASLTTAFTSNCNNPTPGLPPAPNPKCTALSASFSNVLSPVLVMANINGVFLQPQCDDVFLVLVLDGNVIGRSAVQGDPSGQASIKLSSAITALPSMSAGSHGLSVQLFDDFSGCPSGTFTRASQISVNSSSSTLIVRE